MRGPRHSYLPGIAALVSQTANHCLLYPWGGHHDMTVSAHVYTKRHLPRWRTAYRVINGIFFWQDDHCRESFMADVAFAEFVTAHNDANSRDRAMR